MRGTFAMRPRGLGRGDGVAVVATGFAVWPDTLTAGVAWLRRRGFVVHLGPHVLARDGYLAGSDDERESDLRWALTHPDVRAVWFARGGYGTARLLGRVPWRRLAGEPKVLIGYSDLTAIFAPALARRVPCLYGPVVTELADSRAYRAASLRRALAGEVQTLRLRREQIVAEGRGEGPLAGGNLTVLAHLLGTGHAPRLDGSVLFLEEVGEEVYRIDRLLTQLDAAGVLRRLAGVLLGDFTVPAPRRAFPPDRELERVLVERFLPLGVPVVRGFPAGHCRDKLTLPLGLRATIDTRSRRVELGR